MTTRIPSAPVSGAGGQASGTTRRREGGAVLRGVAVRAEPRVLVAPVAPRGEEPEPRGLDGAPGELAAGYGTSGEAYRAQAEAAGAYQMGFQAGRAEAEAELQGARESALQEGFRQGMERGLSDGREQGLAEGREAGRLAVERDASAAREAIEARLAMLNRLLTEVPAEMGRRLAGAEQEMVALAHAVACRILGERLVTIEGVAQHVAQAIREAGDGGLPAATGVQPLTVHVHPVDLAALQGDARLAAWMAGGDAGGRASIRWVSDERVVLGGCIVRSTEGTLDARLEVQMEALRGLLLESRAVRTSVSRGAAPAADGGAQEA